MPTSWNRVVTLKVTLITPAGRGSRAGNRATATRWARRLRELGCRVVIVLSDELRANKLPADDSSAPDVLMVLHAWRSHDAIRAWRRFFPTCPLILVLTGTDVYQFQHSHPGAVLESLEAAQALIGLHDQVGDDIPARFHSKLHVVHQSALPLPPGVPGASRRHFDILVAGHLREEKDSLRAAYAVRGLPEDSRLRVIQLGGPHSEDWARAAEDEMRCNSRYRWLGDRPRWQVRRWMARARLMVISSRMEGGANVVSEACVAGLPIIASNIAGNRGLLGTGYTGYYSVGDTQALRECLLRAERHPDWLNRLKRQTVARAPLFTPEAERDALARVIESIATR